MTADIELVVRESADLTSTEGAVPPELTVTGSFPASSQDRWIPVATESADRMTRRRWPQIKAPIVVPILLLVALSLVMIDVRNGPTEQLRAIGQNTIGEANSWAARWLGPVVAGPVRRDSGQEAREELAQLRQQLAELATANDTLTEQLAQRSDAPAPVPGYTFRHSPVLWLPKVDEAGTMLIGSGSADGVEPGMAVVDAAGLIGVTADVGRNTATVRTITHPLSAVGVRHTPTREMMRVVGTGAGLRVDLVPQFAAVAEGQTLVTIGSPDGSPFPSGIPVGTIGAEMGAPGAVDRTGSALASADVHSPDWVTVLLPEGTP